MAIYDPKLNVMTYGPLVIDGYSEGSMISAKLRNPQTTDKVGGKGDVVAVMSADERGDVEITLMQSAPMNQKLSSLYYATRASGRILLPLFITNTGETTVVTAAEAYIVGPAEVDLGSDAGERKWIFGCHRLILSVGGAIDVNVL